MTRMFECHITFENVDNEHFLRIENLAQEIKWKVSFIEGDPALGPGRRLFLTAHGGNYSRLEERMRQAIDEVRKLGVQHVREKIEHIVLDSKYNIMPQPAVEQPRIYFVGSHATGKTTLTRWVNRSYGLPMITETARAVLSEMETNIPELRADPEKTNSYQERVFAKQRTVEEQPAFVSDRAFDNLAYAAEHSSVLYKVMHEPGFDEYMQRVAEGTVFFVRPHKSLMTEDGVREPADWDAIVRIDGMVKLLLEQFRIPYMPINTPSMQERMTTVRFVLDLMGLKPKE